MGYRTFCLGGGDPNGYYAANLGRGAHRGGRSRTYTPSCRITTGTSDSSAITRRNSCQTFCWHCRRWGRVCTRLVRTSRARTRTRRMRKEPLRPFMFQWCVMALAAAAVMHVQVATRFLSVSPAVYWYLARVGANEGTGTKDAKDRQHVLRGVRARRHPDVPDLLPVDVTCNERSFTL